MRRLSRWVNDAHFWLESAFWVVLVLGGTLTLCLMPWWSLPERPARRRTR